MLYTYNAPPFALLLRRRQMPIWTLLARPRRRPSREACLCGYVRALLNRMVPALCSCQKRSRSCSLLSRRWIILIHSPYRWDLLSVCFVQFAAQAQCGPPPERGAILCVQFAFFVQVEVPENVTAAIDWIAKRSASEAMQQREAIIDALEKAAAGLRLS